MNIITANPAKPLTSAADVAAWLDEQNIPFIDVATLNWAKEFPLKPSFKVRVARTADALVLNYRVQEPAVRAVANVDCGAVWEDACAECFIKAPEDAGYYNIECNCIGTLLIAYGQGRETRQPLEVEALKAVKRYASLGRTPFEVRKEPTTWELSLIVPFALLPHLHDDGQRTDYVGNIYKCGDKLPEPHFVTLYPIDVPSPDYHRPEFFQ